jgi:uncharacterized protein
MSILDLFAASPIKPLQEHMRVVLEAVEQLSPLFVAVCGDDRRSVAEVRASIDTLEGQADRLKNDLRAHLPKRLFMPVDRRDLLEILDLQDSMADRCQDIAELLSQKPMSVPPTMRDPIRELVEAVLVTCRQSKAIVDRLDELLEIGFRGREAERVEAMIDELGRLEGRTDELESRLITAVFQLEAELSPVSVMLWYHLVQWIGDVADGAEKVGNRMRLLIAT